MKNKFNYYAICWVVALAIFNVACFASPAELEGYSKFGGAFWVGYIFITLAFLAQLAASYKAFEASTKEKFFLNVSLIRISYTALIVMLVVGGLCMAIPDLPNWIGVILCFAILGFSIISVVKAQAAGELVEETEAKVQAQTAFIKSLTVDVNVLMQRASDDKIKAEIKKVYEAVRYSDPMSNVGLSGIEAEIAAQMNTLRSAVTSGDCDAVAKEASEMINLVNERSQRCKLLK